MTSNNTTNTSQSSTTAPISIPMTKSNSSVPVSPANSEGSRGRKREREDDESLPGSPPDPDAPIAKKRKTPPTESQSNIPPMSPFPGRVAKIQQQVRELSWEEIPKAAQPEADEGSLANSTSNTPVEAEGMKETTSAESAYQKSTSAGGLDQPPSLPASGRSSPTKLNGSKYPRRFGPGQEKPIEVDTPEKSLKRKASDRIYGAPNSEPLQKKSKDEDPSKTAIPEETPVPTKPSPVVKKAPAPELTGFAAFASGPSPFAMVKAENSPFGKGPSKSTIFGSSAVAPSFSTSFSGGSSWSSAFKSNASSLPSVFSSTPSTPKVSKEDETSEEKGAGYDSSAPPPSKRVKPTPTFGSSSSASSKTPKFGATSVVGQGSGSIYAKSPFATFASSPSPSSGSGASKRRAKSPRPQAFGAYSTGAARFAVPDASPSTTKKPELENEAAKENGSDGSGDGATSADDDTSGKNSLDIARPISRANDKSPLGLPSRENSFAEMLASSGKGDGYEEEEKKPVFTEPQTMLTGEEDEVTVFHNKAKLYYMDEEGQWKERGAGTFKLNMSKERGVAPRMIMRRDGSLTLLLNAKLFKGMQCAAGPDPRYVSLTILDESLKPKAHLLRVNNSKLAQDLLERIQAHIPK